MKLTRISHRSLNGPRYATVLASAAFPLPADFNFERSSLGETTTSLPLDDVKLLAPVVPSKVVCVGRNYREHAAELGNKMPDEPLLFLKAPSAVIGSEDKIELPSASQQVEHEG